VRAAFPDAARSSSVRRFAMRSPSLEVGSCAGALLLVVLRAGAGALLLVALRAGAGGVLPATYPTSPGVQILIVDDHRWNIDHTPGGVQLGSRPNQPTSRS